MAWQIQLENLPFPANLYLRKSYGFKNKNHGPVPENAGISLFKIHWIHVPLDLFSSFFVYTTVKL